MLNGVLYASWSFVRSVTMDSWSDAQLAKMKVRVAIMECRVLVIISLLCQVGGNRRCKNFFEKYGVPKSMSIKVLSLAL